MYYVQDLIKPCSFFIDYMHYSISFTKVKGILCKHKPFSQESDFILYFAKLW